MFPKRTIHYTTIFIFNSKVILQVPIFYITLQYFKYITITRSKTKQLPCISWVQFDNSLPLTIGPSTKPVTKSLANFKESAKPKHRFNHVHHNHSNTSNYKHVNALPQQVHSTIQTMPNITKIQCSRPWFISHYSKHAFNN